ncbi:MAG TPA: hypothetical protein VFA07_03535 [Chthonomonadaceae bacterium]|nr:hypothetical protein [Chthonomonadaceae bacterium]
MAQSDARQPSRIYRGTVDEVFSHRSEIPPNATVELNVFEDKPESGDFGGKSLADVIQEIGAIKGLPADLSTNPKHMQDFGKTRNRRTLKP